MTKQYVIYPLVMACLWGGSLFVDRSLEERAPTQPWTPDEVSVMFKGKALKVVSMGYDAAMADYMFMKFIQYFAYCDDNKLPMVKLYPLADAISDLDPAFGFIYQLAWNGLVNFDTRPIEKRIEEGGKILRKGWRNNSGDWKIAQDLAFHDFFYENRLDEAANMYEKVYEMRKPKFALYALLAARLRARTGGLQSSLIGLQMQYEQANDPKLKEELERRILFIRTEQSARALDQKVEEFIEKNGRFPHSIEEMVQEGLLPGIPADAFGKPFIWNTDKNRIESQSMQTGDVHSGRYELHFGEGYMPPWKKKGNKNRELDK